MQSLMSATGLKSGSIYNTFGSKDGLFTEALGAYTAASIDKITDSLSPPNEVLQGIVNLLENMLGEVSKNNYCSCFLIKTQLELADHGGELFNIARDDLAKIGDAYQEHLATIFSLSQSEERAHSLMMHIYGLHVYGYQRNISSAQLRRSLEVGLAWLPWQPG